MQRVLSVTFHKSWDNMFLKIHDVLITYQRYVSHRLSFFFYHQ